VHRREFIALVGGVALAVPLPVLGQEPRTVGFLTIRSAGDFAAQIAAFRRGLSEAGFIEGHNVKVEYRFANGRADLLPSLAADLVARGVAVIAAPGGAVTAKAAKAATTTIPIVFVVGGDPVTLGLVPSLNRPGGNVTGVSWLVNSLAGKQFEYLHELVPTGKSFGLLINPSSPNAETDTAEVLRAARSKGIQILIFGASSEAEIDSAFAAIREQRASGLIVDADAFLLSRRDQILKWDAQVAVPTIYVLRDFAVGGGLMSYGTSLNHAVRLAGSYTGQILKGEHPADLPVQEATRIELVINLRTATKLGLTVPAALLARADEVIE
jgi:ABC-type uncharacterized transport system substrate-binding protein